MKAMRMPKEMEPLLEFAEESAEETLVFTRNKRPVAALVSLKNIDRESLSLSTNPQFRRIIEKARREIRAGKTTSLEEVERRVRKNTPP